MSGTIAADPPPVPDDGEGRGGDEGHVVEATPELVSVEVRVSWIPLHDDSREGRVVLHRTVRSAPADGPGAGGAPVQEMWLSDRISPARLLELPPVGDEAPPWTELILGRPVFEVSVPLPLHEAHDDELRELAAILEHPAGSATQRPLAAASASARTSESGSLALDELTVGRSRGEVLAPPFARVLVPPDVKAVDVPHVAKPHREPDACRRQVIELSDVRGVQLDKDNLQTTVFIARAEARADFGETLARADVHQAIQRLQADPTNEGRRRTLTAVLGNDWLFSVRQQTLRVGPDDGPLSLLQGLVSFVMPGPVQGLQTGDGGRQQNTFIYHRTTTPTGAALLRGNPRLAAALTDQLVPPVTGSRSVAALGNALRDAVGALPVEWCDGRTHGVRASPGMLPNVVRVSRADGLAIGSGSRQINRTVVEVAEVATPPRPTPLPPPSQDSDGAAADVPSAP